MRSSRPWPLPTPPALHDEAPAQRATAAASVTGPVGGVRLRAAGHGCRVLPSNTLRPVAGLPVRQHVPVDAGAARRLRPDVTDRIPQHPVSYTHLTLPTILRVEISVVAVSL